MSGTRRSVAVFAFDPGAGALLLLKRVPAKGGGWQPVTGRMEDADAAGPEPPACEPAPEGAPAGDHAALVRAALRELEEETGITRVERVMDLGVESTFTGYDGRTYAERAFAVVVAPGARVTRSDEHEAYRWVPLADAPDALTYPENKRALERLVKRLQRNTHGA